ncbi:MAG: hypothetical protein Q7W45_16505 [Bacteroidota bacterium]|nr:hypothetical protein [Bacteroidota bacterium]MDP3145382.1 hypothetical protein [Bacteroidota bacterium]MDP3557600.1 hypothetical protein [Bacteroidota bacterium]
MFNGIESLSKCKSILQKDGSVYTDEQVIEIKNFLYKLAEMDYSIFLKQKMRELEFKKTQEEQDSIKEEEFKQVA